MSFKDLSKSREDTGVVGLFGVGLDIKRTTTPNIFKNKVKKVILDCQGEGETIEWKVDNFALYKCKGLRAGSNKRNKETVRYTQFF